jgi:hypothetical protein
MISLTIKYLLLTIKFTGIKNGIFYYRCDKIDQFINSLSNNKNCIYEECYDVYKYFSIELINDIIKIKRGDVEINKRNKKIS